MVRTAYTDYMLYRAQKGMRFAMTAAVAVDEALNGERVVILSATGAYAQSMRNRILRELWRREAGFWNENGTLELDSDGSIRLETPKAPIRGIPAYFLEGPDPAESEG